MFDRLIQLSLRNRLVVVAVAALLVVYGVFTLLSLPVDVLPDLNRPTVTVMTEANGLSADDVELLVTRPIEVSLNGAPGIERVRSASAFGLSIVWAEFGWDTELLVARQQVNERLQVAAASLPLGTAPVMTPISSIMGEIMLIGLTSKNGATSPIELRSLADWTIRQRLLAIPGVAQVVVIGGGVKQYQVEVAPDRLMAQGITLREVEQAVAGSQRNTAGGFLERFGQEFLIRNVGRTTSLEDLGNAVVARRGNAQILLRQLGQVAIGPAVKRGDASVNGRPGVILSVRKQPRANTLVLTEQIQQALRDLQPSLPRDIKSVELFKQANFIQVAVDNVKDALRDGSILVVIVLVLFLVNFRTTVITLTAIPLSLVITAVVFKAFGLSINTMTLGGLAVAIGELVDDAIVDVENVLRRLRENRQLPNSQQRPALEVIYRASSEVRNSIVFATILVVLVFVPLFSLSGIEGRIFAPLGVAYIVSILASLVVSLTVTPALCSYLLPESPAAARGDGALVTWIKDRHRRLLRHTLEQPRAILWSAAVLVVVAALSLPLLGTEFLPPFNEGTATVELFAPPGTSLTESNRIGTMAEKLLRKVPEVVSTGRRTGRAELDEHAEGVNYSEVEVQLRPSDRSRSEILDDVRRELAQIQGITVSLGQPITHRLDHILSGVRAQISIKVFGNDLTVLRTKAEEIRREIAGIPGIVDLRIEQQALVPRIQIEPRRDAAVRYGVQVGALTEILETAFNGRKVGQIFDGQRAHDVRVRYDAHAREDVDTIRRALVDTPLGTPVPLGSLANVVVGVGPNVIYHENVQRRIVLSCNVSGSDLGTVVQKIQETVRQIPLPTGTFVTYGGGFESQEKATRLIALLALIAIAGMFLVLYVHFRSSRIVAQILVNIPLAMVGGLAAIWISGTPLSVASLVGFVTVTGIAARNTIMMISHYLHLVRHEGEGFTREMVTRGSLERLVPLLMTALTASLALVPLVLAREQPGKEILHPVALVIFGGLMTSTLLDLVVTPAVFWEFGRPSVERLFAAEKAAGPHPPSGAA